MNTFIFKRENIARLKALNSYIKKLEGICPLDSNELFVVNDGKLTVYGHGNGSLGAGYIEASYDIETSSSFYFVTDIQKFIQLLEKTRSDSISVTMNESSQLIFKGDASSSKFTQVVMTIDGDEAKEISNAVSMYKTSNPYNSSVDLNVADVKDDLNSASSILGILNVNKFMRISSKHISTADNISVIDINAPSLDCSEEIYLHKNVPSLLAEVDSFKICKFDGSYWIYIDIASQGIELYFAEPQIDYQSPSDEEIAEMLPKEEHLEVEIDSGKFIEALSEFDGVFDSASWRYGQVKFIVDFDESQFNLHFDNMVSCVDTVLPFTVVDDKISEKKQFMMQLPTLHLKSLYEDLKSQPTFRMKLSPKADDILVSLTNDKLSVNLVKMED